MEKRGQAMSEVFDLEAALAADHMHAGVLACAPETSLADVARMMARHRIHCVVVLGDGADHSSWGVVSDVDLVELAAAGTIDGSTAGYAAATPTIVVHPGDTLAHAAQLMAENGVTHLIVAKSQPGRPLGVLSSLDLARALVGA
jgi:CBS domain-containing protein